MWGRICCGDVSGVLWQFHNQLFTTKDERLASWLAQRGNQVLEIEFQLWIGFIRSQFFVE
jgi:hypothetical protein